jgi:hypothetical protein
MCNSCKSHTTQHANTCRADQRLYVDAWSGTCTSYPLTGAASLNTAVYQFLKPLGVQNLNWSVGKTDRRKAKLLKTKIDEEISRNKLLGTPKRRTDSNVIRPEVLMISKTEFITQEKNIPFVFI